MQENEQVVELNLKALLFYVLRQWKSMVTFAVVIALLLAALMGFLEYRTGLEVDMTNDYWVEYQRYEDQLSYYRNQVHTTQNRINNLNTYIQNSVLMQADSKNIFIANVSYLIETDEAFSGNISALARNYLGFLEDRSIYADVAESVGLDPTYLMELVQFNVITNDSITITVSHPSRDAAKTIMSAFQEKVAEAHDHLEVSLCPHGMTVMVDTLSSFVSEDLNKLQQTTYADLVRAQNDILTYRQELYKLEKDGGPGELSIPFALIKGIILGGVLGGVLAVVWFFFLGLLRNRVLAPEQLLSGYGLPVLGELLRDSGAKDPIGSRLNKWEGRLSGNSAENTHYIAENIRNHSNGASRILVTSDMGAEESAALVNAVKAYLPEVTFVPAGSLLNNAVALKELALCDGVLCMVSRDRTGNASVSRELQLIRECEKTVLGFVFIS